MSNFNVIENNLPGFRGEASLIQNEETEEYFVISTVIPHNYDNDFETLAFKADESGNVVDWLEVAGGRNMSASDVILSLEHLPDDTGFDSSMFSDDEWEDFVREDGTLLDPED